MTRTLEQLIEQFNRAVELDALNETVTGETYWIQIDGIRTRMIDTWVSGLSPEERKIFNEMVLGIAT